MSVKNVGCPVDLEEGLARAGDDREFYKELLEIFLDDVPERMKLLRNALKDGDGEQVARAAHAIKGAAANLSATQIFETALQLEQWGREGQLDQSAASIASLDEALVELRAFLANF